MYRLLLGSSFDFQTWFASCVVPVLFQPESRSMIILAFFEWALSTSYVDLPLATVVTNFSLVDHFFNATHPVQSAITFNPAIT